MGIRALASLVSKDLKIFGRSKVSASVIILAPVLIILFAGYVFNSTGLSGIVIGVHSEIYTPLTEDILNGFEGQNFAVNKLNSQQECTESVKSGKTQICIIFPNDLSESGSAKDVIFYVDKSRINLAYILINDIESKISSKASTLGIALAQDLINALDSVKKSLPEQKTKISESLNGINQINKKADNEISSSDIDDALEYLNNAKNLLEDSNNSEIKNNVADSITALESVKETNSQVSEDLTDIEIQGKELSMKLEKIYSELSNLVNSLEGVNIVEAKKIVSPIQVKIESISSNSNSREYLLPTLLALMALFGGVLLSSTVILKERKNKAYFRNFTTPTWDATFILSSYLTCLIILSVQFLLIFAGIEFVLKMPLLGVLQNVIFVLFVSLTVFIFLGMVIGYLFRSDETTIFASVLTATVLMFFSNTLLPIETISGSFKKFAMFNPLVVSDIAFKKVILFDFNLTAIFPELLILTGFFILFVILTYIGRKITKRML